MSLFWGIFGSSKVKGINNDENNRGIKNAPKHLHY